MDSAQLRAASCHPGPRESGACARDAQRVASSRAPGHPLLAPCHTVRPAAQDPACCSCSVNSGVTARSRGRGRGDPRRPFLHRAPQPCRGRAPGSRGAAGPANGPLKASLSSGSGTVAFHGPHPGFPDCHPQSWPSARIFRSVSSGEAGRGCQAPPRLRLEAG